MLACLLVGVGALLTTVVTTVLTTSTAAAADVRTPLKVSVETLAPAAGSPSPDG